MAETTVRAAIVSSCCPKKSNPRERATNQVQGESRSGVSQVISTLINASKQLSSLVEMQINPNVNDAIAIISISLFKSKIMGIITSTISLLFDPA